MSHILACHINDTGTSFDLPLLVQVERLSKDECPNSDNADLVSLWTIKENDEQTV